MKIVFILFFLFYICYKIIFKIRYKGVALWTSDDVIICKNHRRVYITKKEVDRQLKKNPGGAWICPMCGEISDCVPKGFDTDFLVNNSIKGLKGIKK